MSKLDDIIKKVKARKPQYDDKPRAIKPPPGKSIWRVLPGWDKADPLNFFHAFGQHYLKDGEGKIKLVIGCPERTYDKPCEICELISVAIAEAPDDETRKRLKDARAQQVYLVNAVQVDKDANEPVIMAMPRTLFENSMMEVLEEYGPDMLDLNEGNDLIINRDGTGIDTKYTLTVRSAAKSKPIPESVWQKALNLEEYVREDFEAKLDKAKAVIASSMGELPPALSDTGGSGGPGTRSITDETERKSDESDGVDELDVEDLIEGTATEVEEPKEEEKKEAEKSFGSDVTDEDLDDILAGL